MVNIKDDVLASDIVTYLGQKIPRNRKRSLIDIFRHQSLIWGLNQAFRHNLKGGCPKVLIRPDFTLSLRTKLIKYIINAFLQVLVLSNLKISEFAKKV